MGMEDEDEQSRAELIQHLSSPGATEGAFKVTLILQPKTTSEILQLYLFTGKLKCNL